MFSSLFRGLSLDNNNNRNFIPLPEAEKEIEEISNLFEKNIFFK